MKDIFLALGRNSLISGSHMNKRMLVGFTVKTSAVLPKFFCPLFRHCSVVIDGMLIQIGTDGVRLFRCGTSEIKKLENAGWVFVQLTVDNGQLTMNNLIPNCQLLTCVGFAKRVLGIKNPFIWTPDQLFRFLIADSHGYR